MLKRKTNIFVTILFTFVAFMLIGTTNVNAATATVMSEEELNSAIADTSTTEIKLGTDIVLKDNLNICTTPDLTLDLNGYTIDGETNSKTVYIYFGRNTSDEYTDCSLTIKDSSPDKTGTIRTSGYIYINSRFVKEKSVTITIEGGNFYTKTNGSFYLKPDGYMKNTKVNFFIKEGYFKNNFYVDGASKLLRIGTDTQTIEGSGITLNIKFDKLTYSGSLYPNLIYLEGGTLTLDDVVSKDSKIKVIYPNSREEEVEQEITDRTISATSGKLLNNYYSTIKITKDYCFDVSDVTLTETYGYGEATSVPISIYNRGERQPNISLLKAYSDWDSSPRIESEDFIIDIKDKLMPSGATNASNTIKAKTGLSVGDYEATIAVADSAGNTYTSKVTLTVKPKKLLNFGIGGVSKTITYGTSYDPKPTVTGTNPLTSADYKIAYFKRGATTPLNSKPTDVGEYTVAIALTNKNYEASNPVISFDYEITAKSLNADGISVTLEQASFEYTGSEIKPAPVVKDGTKTLIRGRDYTLSYSENINTGDTAKVTVTGKGNYIGSVEKTFSITSRTSTGEMQQIINFTDSSITKTYGDSNFTIEVNQITGDGTITYSSSEPTVATVDGTTGEVTIKGVGTTTIRAVAAVSGDYATAEATYTLTVNKKQLVKPELSENSFEYNGKNITIPEPEAYYADFMDISGDTTKIAVGNYQVRFSLINKTNSEWVDETTDDVVIDWYITGVKLEKPELTQTSFVYTGKPIAISVPSTVRIRYMRASGDLEKTDVGNYQMTFALKDTENCKWTDGTTGNVTLPWKIEKATPTIAISNLSQKVGSVVEPTYTISPAVTDGTVKVEYKLSTAEDSTYTETLPTEAGIYSVKVSVSGDKNLINTSEVATLEIINPTTILEDWVTVNTSTTHIYSGSPIKPTVTVYDGTNTLVENTDYILYYENNINAGTAKVKVYGIGNYTGEIEKEFTITPKTITLTIGAIVDQTYTGEQITPGIIIGCAETLTKGTDYTVVYGTNIDVGTGKVTIKAVSGSNYKFDDVTQTFNIVSNTTTTKTKLTKVTLKESSYSYSGSAISVEFNNYNDSLMTKTGDLTGTNAKSDYSITIALKDTANYEWADGTTADLTLTWKIEKANPTIEISNLSQKVGSVVAPTYTVTPAVTDGTVKVEYKLSTAEDSTYIETLPTEAGTYNVKVSVTGDKNLNDTSEIATLTITKKTTGGGGGSSTTTYAITVKENENAEVTPNGTVKVEKGADKTFKIKAKEGYEIEDVLVDGKSVGAVSKYTFENVKAKHTLEVKVKKAEEKPTTSETKETFKDVKKGDWYFEAVEYVAKKGLMNGTGNNEFSPDETATRGMIVTILYRLEGEPAVEECSFTDVPSDAYYAKAIAWAEKNGIVLGLGEGKFGPDEEITREQLVAIMYRYSMYKKYDTSVAEDTNILSYNDIQNLEEYAFTAMQYACGEGLITGVGNGNLDPKGNAARAQVATILMRYCEKYMK